MYYQIAAPAAVPLGFIAAGELSEPRGEMRGYEKPET